jgi:hypothetical protein
VELRMTIDRQRIKAVEMLQQMGFRFSQNHWRAPVELQPRIDQDFLEAADALHDELVGQCEELMGALEESSDTDELDRLIALVQDYELSRSEG